MQPSELISLVKEGETPSTAALDSFCTGLADFSVSDAQGAAFAMAVCLKGLNVRGRKDLTLAMRDSGTTLSWNLDGPVLDKHSTGGLGDCVSLVLAPLLAAAGIYVPMISGRGLGHTGGTLDKMEAIPGVSVNIEVNKLKNIVSEIGCAIVLKESTNISEKEIIDYASKKIAKFKIPSKFIFLDEIPKGPTGKIQRIGLSKILGLENGYE